MGPEERVYQKLSYQKVPISFWKVLLDVILVIMTISLCPCSAHDARTRNHYSMEISMIISSA